MTFLFIKDMNDFFFFFGDTWVFIAQNTCQLGFGPFEPGSISVDPPKHSSRQFPFDYSSGKKKKKKTHMVRIDEKVGERKL